MSEDFLDNQLLNEEELDHLNKIGWEDIESDLIKNKELLRSEPVSMHEEAPKKDYELEFILDLPLKVVVEIGRKKILINKFLGYEVGSIVELDKRIGQTLDILVNDYVVGEGVIVVQNKRFCIKITTLFESTRKMSVFQPYV